jgi:hypothetical protein
VERTEKEVERYLCKRVKELGGKAYKFVSPGNAGVPDRLVVVPTGADKTITAIYLLVEVKKPGGKLRPQQRMKIKELCDMGADCRIVDSYERVDKVILELETAVAAAAFIAAELSGAVKNG